MDIYAKYTRQKILVLHLCFRKPQYIMFTGRSTIFIERPLHQIMPYFVELKR